ncbi:hypothetical protein HELRODRAFT_167342 [Helobdella robusta]|uniref:Uncharacterized protein n=1 Tax=Helobdella robusta TaxID=6412 RepID=T1EZA1_HELRO|nr:hypothetical protein HELRODRAFT_167342 [Helobdella robusta]ESO10839.1 hypothetical protein HELRODRAFT_167342 [Helobdella robusta]
MEFSQTEKNQKNGKPLKTEKAEAKRPLKQKSPKNRKLVKRATAKEMPMFIFTSEDPKSMTTIRSWYCTLLRKSSNQNNMMERFQEEACNTTMQSLPNMSPPCEIDTCMYFNKTRDLFTKKPSTIKYPAPLTSEECVAVHIYTSSFAFKYNCNTRKGFYESYKVYTSLLLSAGRKINAMPQYKSKHSPKIQLYRDGLKKNRTMTGGNEEVYSGTEKNESAATESDADQNQKSPSQASKMASPAIFIIFEQLLIRFVGIK